MPKAKKNEKAKQPMPRELKGAALRRLEKIYGQHLTDSMGRLHNRMVAYISEARIPLPHVVMVLDLLKDEAVELARREYMKVK